MPFLRITTLGTLALQLDDQPVAQRADYHRGMLLVELALHQGRRSRTQLAQRLWPYAEPQLGRTNLRSLLKRMNQEGLTHALTVERNEIRLDVDAGFALDLLTFRELAQAARRLEQAGAEPDAVMQRLAAAADLYQGEFLAGVDLRDNPELEEWVARERRALEIEVSRILQRLGHTALVTQQFATGLTATHRLLELAPLDDDAHILHMRLLARDGQVGQALRHLEEYRAQVVDELGDDAPLDALRELDVELRSGAWVERLTIPQSLPAAQQSPDAPDTEGEESAEESWPATSLPYIPHPLVGRRREQAALHTLLADGHRLVTVVGLGGVGKTFFVRSQLETLQQRFDAVHFVDLRSALQEEQEPAATLLQNLASDLDLSPQPGSPLQEQVTQALAAGSRCLILDNFETVHQARSTVLELLHALPRLAVIVTSRRRLRTGSEALVALEGLAVEPNGAGGSSEAAAFFVHCVQRVQPAYAVTPENVLGIDTLCRQVAGLPLAIELAALQIDFYSLDELVAATAAGADLLEAPHDDQPADQQSIRTLLESMWRTLGDQGRTVLAQVSVFAGAFHRDAMQAVAPAPRAVYQGLVNASLLRVDEPAWFSLHPLVRQYASERLHAAFDVEDTAQRHSRHYLASLDLGDQPMETRAIVEPAVWSRLQRNVADIHLAWRWAVQRADWASLAQAVTSFAQLHRQNGLDQRGYALLEELMQALPPEAEWSALQTHLAGRAALFLNILGIYGGDPAAAEPWIEQAITWLDTAGTAHDQVAARYQAGMSVLSSPERWGNVPTLLAQGLALAQQNDLSSFIVKIQMFFALLVYLPTGQWRAAVDAARQAVTAYGDLSTVIDSEVSHILGANGVSVFLCCLELDEAERLLAATEPALDQPQQPFMGGARAMRALFQCTLLAHRGEVDTAIDGMQSAMRLYTEEYSTQASLAYGFLALCLARRGDFSEAIATARQGLAHIEALGGGYLLGYAQQCLAEVLLMAEDFVPVAHKDEVLALLEKSLAGGQEFKDVQVIFPALYALVHARRAEIPPALFERMIKIGACSPALYYEMHPIGRERLAAEGIVLTDEEAEALYDTDLEAVKALAAEIRANLS